MTSRARRALVLLVAAVVLLLIGGRITAEFLEELLWFRSMGMEQVYWTRWGAAAVARTTAGLLVAAAVFGNLWVVTRSLGSIRVRRRFANLEIAERLPQVYILAALAVIAAFSGWWLSAALSDPVALLAALRHARWGIQDPIFGLDLSFYVFVLPVLEQVQTLAGVLIAWIAVLVVSSYVATGSFKVGDGAISISEPARRQVGLLGAAFLVVVAWDLWMDRYALLLDGHGIGGSLGYTDVHARLPALLVVALLALIAAAAVGGGLWAGRGRPALVAVAALVLVRVGGTVVYPALVQKLVVEPNEFGRESRFLQQHLRFTRLGYDLEDIQSVRLPYRDSVSLSEASVTQALAGAPLWDPRPLLDVFNREESLRTYYQFLSVHADRYGGEQVAVAVRELDPAELPAVARTWQNLHLRYVHGEGAVVIDMSRMSNDGNPSYLLRDLAPAKLSAEAPRELALQDASVYFGEGSSGYVVVDPEARPLGVPLGSSWRKLVYAWAFQSKNLLLSGSVTPGSRIVYRRAVRERVRALAPFLHLLPEGGVLPVIHEGRVVWVVDGYTTTSWFPLSASSALGRLPVRYIRNSVKATVDAVSGEVRLYGLDQADPILRSYAAIFPGLVRPLEEMPAALREHLRFPSPLLDLQAVVLGDYHLRDPASFYAREDVWVRATETYRNEPHQVAPLYATLQLPGQATREFVLSVPLVAQRRPNLAALLVARNDPPHYGQRLLYELPRDELVPGPQQIESQIDQNPEISQQLSLWKGGGSEAIRGNMLIVPVDSTLLYLEPLFLEAEQTAIPQLERVILASARRVVMRPTLAQAVSALVTGAPEPAEAPPAEATERRPAQEQPGSEALARARRLLQRAEAQLRAGDWAGFGQTWRALREALSGEESAP